MSEGIESVEEQNELVSEKTSLVLNSDVKNHMKISKPGESSFEFVKELDEQTQEQRDALISDGFDSLLFEIREKRVRRNQYIKKLQTALGSELEHYRHQMQIISKSSQKISQSLYEELITNARKLRDNFMQVTHIEIIEEFQKLSDRALEDYEEALMRCPLPEHENELINQARRQRIDNCTKTYLVGIEAIQKIFDKFQSDWASSDSVLQLN